MTRSIDCVVCGSCVVDLLCRPVSLTEPIGRGVLHHVEPIMIVGGGITSNSGVTLARLGLKTAILSYVGNDAWAPVIRNLYRGEGIDDSPLLTHPTGATSSTVVTIEATGERSFFHCVGAPKLLDAKAFLDRLDLFARTRVMLLGYYSLMPNLENDLPDVFAKIRKAGCQTAMDSAGSGGGMSPLDRILPHLDYWVPSFSEAKHQTGLDDPRRIIKAYRACGAPGLLGVKLGSKGVLLSPKADEYVEIPVVPAPGPVVDTTGAGDSFYAGLLGGLLKGLPLEKAGRLGAAAGACCVTAWGGSTGGRDYAFSAKLAGI
ncbi:MAG: carbohydrate kinase family protein [Planctomycetota bacterium]|nr:carbohydrate kinase family protein [Planctomycetota bacterium]